MYVDDVDAVVQQAVDAGATITTEVVIARARSPTRLARCG